jgi:hypothetical protein
MGVAFVLVSHCIAAPAQEFRCIKAYPEMDPGYARVVCEGNEMLERGNARRALELYRKAAQLPFSEGPNFLIYYRISAAQCQLGLRRDAQETLAQFEEMLQIYTGARRCSREMTPRLSETVMCAEAFSPDSYAEPAGMQQRVRLTKAYRERIAALKRTCPAR